MVNKQYNLGFCSCDIVKIDLYKGESYNYASVGVKKGKNQYIYINYEWQGDVVPDFILDMANYFIAPDSEDDMEGNGPGMMVSASVDDEKYFAEFLQRLSKNKLV